MTDQRELLELAAKAAPLDIDAKQRRRLDTRLRMDSTFATRNEEMMTRGFAAIGLHQPKDPLNVGEVLRAAGCYGAAMIAASGTRYRRARTDTQAAHRHLPLLTCEDLRTMIPHGAVPVAVDLIEGAQALPGYKHPTSAFYVFGPEDGTLGPKILAWCRDVVYVPTRHCMNLAATVNVVLYDRAAKQAG